MHHVIVQRVEKEIVAPTNYLLRKWAQHALNQLTKPVEVTIRIVGIKEMSQLNKKYRQKVGPTNVLSFPFHSSMHDNLIPTLPITLLGDIVICAEIVNDESKVQQKERNSHWAHMVIHGTLHLLGYDHVKDNEAVIMEDLEIKMMTTLGFKNPYIDGDNISNYE